MSSTKTQQPYFPHYANSHNEDDMIRLRMFHGVAGYGVYYMLLERLRMSENYQADLDYEILCWDLDCDEDLIRSVIYDFGLFEIVCDGQKFQSVEMIAYMQLMEEKKRERSERGRAAAYARYGKEMPTEQSSAIVPDEKEVGNQEVDITINEDSTERLDKEIEVIKNDETWLEAMAKECGNTKEEIISYLKDFCSACLLKGLKGGHKDMIDAFSHFRSWIYKSGRAKDPNAHQSKITYRNTRRMKTEEERAQRDKDIANRNARYARNEKLKCSPEEMIRNWGYDPDEVRLNQVMNPKWRENNPPTHPEWIVGRSDPKALEVPY